MTHVASIIHLTDLHLFVSANGDERSPSERKFVERVSMAALGAVFHGLSTADGTTKTELLRKLFAVAATEGRDGAAVIVLQTGDVDAFGHDPLGHLTAYEFLHGEPWRELKKGASTVDVYGNHDVWPGHPPLPSNPRTTAAIMRLAAFQDDWLTPVEVPVGGFVIRFHRLNTVILDRFQGGILARGGIGPHPPEDPFDATRADAIMSDLAARAATASGPTFDIAVCHHPPHVFGGSRFTRWVASQTLGYLGRSELFQDVTPAPLPLVIAGHRHSLNPRKSVDPAKREQPPLSAGSAQLVSESPTQRDGHQNSLAVYRLQHNAASGTVDVDRARFPYEKKYGFAAEPRVQRVASDLPITIH